VNADTSTNGAHRSSGDAPPTIVFAVTARRIQRRGDDGTGETKRAMSTLEDLAQRIERLLLRHEELKRTNVLLEQQLGAVTAERDSMRSRLAAARARIDALLERLPLEAPAPSQAAASDRDAA
jgi:cell division protein ZapB